MGLLYLFTLIGSNVEGSSRTLFLVISQRLPGKHLSSCKNHSSGDSGICDKYREISRYVSNVFVQTV